MQTNVEIRIANTTTGWFAVVIVGSRRYAAEFGTFLMASSWALNTARDGGVTVVMDQRVEAINDQ